MAVSTGNPRKGPADRWRTPTYAEEMASRNLQPQPERRGTRLGDAIRSTPQQPLEEYVLLRIPRSLLSTLINQEFNMSQNNNAAQNLPTASIDAQAPSAAASLEGLRAARQENQAATAELLTQGKKLDEQIAVIEDSAKPRSVAKTVGKVAGVTAVVGLVAAGAVYGYRLWIASRG